MFAMFEAVSNSREFRSKRSRKWNNDTMAHGYSAFVLLVSQFKRHFENKNGVKFVILATIKNTYCLLSWNGVHSYYFIAHIIFSFRQLWIDFVTAKFVKLWCWCNVLKVMSESGIGIYLVIYYNYPIFIFVQLVILAAILYCELLIKF